MSAPARYSHISFKDRTVIRYMLRDKRTHAEIARQIRKCRSSVTREIRRNTVAGIYYEVYADNRKKQRRKDAKSPFRIIENDPQMEMYVERLLKMHLSPEQVAGYMRRSGYTRPVCFKTVYAWVHRKWQSRKAFLRFKGHPRVEYGARKRSWQPHRRHISERPPVVNRRRRAGDWETDLVHGTKDDSRHCILTLNDRASGFCIGRKITAIDGFTVASVIIEALKGLPVHTITCDNGVPSKFTYALSAWTVELREAGWFVARTIPPVIANKLEWSGPFATVETVCLAIARRHAVELADRHTRSVEFHKIKKDDALYGMKPTTHL